MEEAEYNPDDRDSRLLQDVGNNLANYQKTEMLKALK
jgi:hypothetical protein